MNSLQSQSSGSWPERACRLWLCVFWVGACATPPPPVARDAAPFIKLAARELGLLLAWQGPAPSPGEQEDLERLLVQRFRTTYKTTVSVVRQEGPFSGLPVDSLAYWVERGVDDVLVVQTEATEPRAPMRGRAWVISLADEKVLHEVTIGDIQARTGERTAPRYADMVWREVSRRWTDPGAAPALDPLAAADRLAERSACGPALRLYDALLPRLKPRLQADAVRLENAQLRADQCRRHLLLQQVLANDRTARFALKFEARGLSRRYREVLQDAWSRSSLARELVKYTDKPVLLHAGPDSLVLFVRYHPERYQAWVAGRPTSESAYPVLYLDPLTPYLEAVMDVLELACQRLEPYEQKALRNFKTTLRLLKPPEDWLELAFAELDGRIVMDSTLSLKLADQLPMVVESRLAYVSRTQVFGLGPLEAPSGQITDSGLVYRFFELGK